ncbi:MAG: IS3 family transposase [Caldilineaceae bacterium]|nr:IS3 family transposase [Caldilineaceae bacterium]
MVKKRRRHTAAFKFRVVLEALEGSKTISQLSSEHEIHANQIGAWKRQLLEDGPRVFASNGERKQREQEAQEAELYEQIGRLKMELEWLKKKLPASVSERRRMVDVANPTLSVRRQGELLGLNRSSFYYQAAPESALNLQLMRLIDEQFLRTPFYGWRKMTVYLRRLGYAVNGKRVRRLMRLMGIQAIYPRRSSSSPGKGHKRYPYLLRNLPITHVNQVWSADITYVPLLRGFMYLVAVIDWYSRYVLAWQLSNTLDGIFCLDALRQALSTGRPKIFNTDQGAQFTADAFTACLLAANIQVSMDGRGRALDNVFCERLWRSVKYENIYLNQYDTVPQLQTGLRAYFDFYNHERPHQSLNYRTPAEEHFVL